MYYIHINITGAIWKPSTNQAVGSSSIMHKCRRSLKLNRGSWVLVNSDQVSLKPDQYYRRHHLETIEQSDCRIINNYAQMPRLKLNRWSWVMRTLIKFHQNLISIKRAIIWKPLSNQIALTEVFRCQINWRRSIVILSVLQELSGNQLGRRRRSESVTDDIITQWNKKKLLYFRTVGYNKLLK